MHLGSKIIFVDLDLITLFNVVSFFVFWSTDPFENFSLLVSGNSLKAGGLGYGRGFYSNTIREFGWVGVTERGVARKFGTLILLGVFTFAIFFFGAIFY